jgi:hypothetical protein
MKNFLLYFPIAVWIVLFFIEIFSIFFLHPKPMYFRAWEYVLNEGKDSYYVPFKPNSTYRGKMTGDLLNTVNFQPKRKDIRYQDFIVDEYGFRNNPGTYAKKPETVIIGSSFVGGSVLTQEEIINEMLRNKYKYLSYNYATLPLQHFWEDKRFITHPPEYVFIIGNETEFLQNSWIINLQNTTIKHEVKKWTSLDDWEQHNNPTDLSYQGISKYVRRFSFVKYALHQGYLTIINALLPRSLLFNMSTRELGYKSESDMLFYDIYKFNPIITTTNKKSIIETIHTLTMTQKYLQMRNIKLVIAVVPSKASLYANEYMKIKDSKRLLYLLENEMKKNNIDYIPLLEDLRKISNDKLLYYNDDGHWNGEVNRVITDKFYNTYLKNKSIN